MAERQWIWKSNHTTTGTFSLYFNSIQPTSSKFHQVKPGPSKVD